MSTPKDDPEKDQDRPNIKVEDLPLEKGDLDDVKGGPAYIRIQGVDGEIRPRGS